MSMPIQRQSESFGYFDEGPRYARDRSSTELPAGLAGLMNTSGPRITGGMLNTRTAVNVDGMDPESHAYHTELPSGPGPGREWNPDYGYEPSDEDEHRSELVGEDDDSGFNWGPEPYDPQFGGQSEHAPDYGVEDPSFGEYDKPLNDWEHGTESRQASRHPFDRTAACQVCGGDLLPGGGDWEHVEGPADHYADPDDNDFDNDEYGEGRDPARAYDDFRQHRAAVGGHGDGGGIWSPDPQALLDWHNRQQNDEGHDQQEEIHREAAVGGHAVPWEETEDGWHHPVSGFHVAPSDEEPGHYQLLAPHVGRGDDLAKIYSPHPDPHALIEHATYMMGGPRPTTKVGFAPTPPVPGASAYQPGHRIGLPWRDQDIPGTVIGLDGPHVAVRWDDGQHSSEEPHNIHLL